MTSRVLMVSTLVAVLSGGCSDSACEPGAGWPVCPSSSDAGPGQPDAAVPAITVWVSELTPRADIPVFLLDAEFNVIAEEATTAFGRVVFTSDEGSYVVAGVVNLLSGRPTLHVVAGVELGDVLHLEPNPNNDIVGYVGLRMPTPIPVEPVSVIPDCSRMQSFLIPASPVLVVEVPLTCRRSDGTFTALLRSSSEFSFVTDVPVAAFPEEAMADAYAVPTWRPSTEVALDPAGVADGGLFVFAAQQGGEDGIEIGSAVVPGPLSLFWTQGLTEAAVWYLSETRNSVTHIQLPAIAPLLIPEPSTPAVVESLTLSGSTVTWSVTGSQSADYAVITVVGPTGATLKAIQPVTDAVSSFTLPALPSALSDFDELIDQNVAHNVTVELVAGDYETRRSINDPTGAFLVAAGESTSTKLQVDVPAQ